LPLRAKRNGGFQHQYHFTHKLLKYAVTLFERRARLVKGRRDALQVLVKLYDYNLLSTHMETSEIIAIRNEALINRADIITENPNHGGALKNDLPHEIKTPETK
jgi:hypothetical protein